MTRENDATKILLSETIKKLMVKTPLERLTVTDIVKEAGLTRQTFYRHFRDKYDLVNWCFDGLAEQCFYKMGVSLTLRDGLILKFNFIRNEKNFFMQAFRSTDYNSIEQHDYEFILKFYTEIIEKQLKKPLPENLRFILELYCHGSITMTVQWAVNGMEKSPESMADDLIDSLPPKLAEILLPVLR